MDCIVCQETAGRSRPAVVFHIVRGSARSAVCLPHAMQEDHPCECGTPLWYDFLSGCGDWMPTSDQAGTLLRHLWEQLPTLP